MFQYNVSSTLSNSLKYRFLNSPDTNSPVSNPDINSSDKEIVKWSMDHSSTQLTSIDHSGTVSSGKDVSALYSEIYYSIVLVNFLSRAERVPSRAERM